MSGRYPDIDPRIEELLVDQVIGGLEMLQQQELEALLTDETEKLQQELMQTAALVQVGMLAAKPQTATKMPEHLRQSIAARASLGAQASKSPGDNVVTLGRATHKPSQAPSAARQSDFGRYAGWAVAAALAFAFLVFRTDVEPESPAKQRTQLMSAAPDVISVPWATSDQPGYENVSGDVIWSDMRQQGYMRLAGLPANNPATAQYQLWIVDPDRSAEPVDGGVFDIPSEGGEFIVPVQAKLNVDKPVAFAITLEKPGGVVVSAGPLLVVAPVGS